MLLTTIERTTAAVICGFLLVRIDSAVIFLSGEGTKVREMLATGNVDFGDLHGR